MQRNISVKLIKLLVYSSLLIFIFAKFANAQSVNGDGNIIIRGDSNKVRSNMHISDSFNTMQIPNYNSLQAKEDLANGNHKRIHFTEKKATASNKKKLLIMTATNYETKKIHEAAEKAGLDVVKEIINDQIIYNMGTLGGVEVLQMQAGVMGMLEPSSTPLALLSVFNDVKPDYIISTGIAFGRKSKGQKLGEIILSRQIVNYETRKEKDGDIYFRGDKVTSPMLRRVSGGIHSWKGPKVHDGLVLSGNVLINSKEFLQLLSQREPEYVGGDMESYGIYSVSAMMGSQWIMIKGISDWGDGTKNDASHGIALENVGEFIFHIIKDSNLT